MRDSEEHAKLKRKAEKFLKSLGFDEIIEEYSTGVRYSDYYFIMNTEARVDIVGLKGNRIALRARVCGVIFDKAKFSVALLILGLVIGICMGCSILRLPQPRLAFDLMMRARWVFPTPDTLYCLSVNVFHTYL